jgi:hypothetical protein
MSYPSPDVTVPPASLQDCLDEALKLLEARPEPDSDVADVSVRVSADFERLRWFELPAVCLSSTSE